MAANSVDSNCRRIGLRGRSVRSLRPGLTILTVAVIFSTVPLPVGEAVPGVGAAQSRVVDAGPRRLEAAEVLDSLSSVAVLDDFETGPWPTPGLWYLPPSTAPMWWPSTCLAASGRRSLRAFGGPSLDGEVPCDYRPPAGKVSTVYLDLDLRGAVNASRLELYFQLWMQVPNPLDGSGQQGGLFLHLLVPKDGGFLRVPVFGASGGNAQWVVPTRFLDLMALADVENPTEVYDLRGGQWRMEWSAVAPPNLPPGGGIFIDDLVLLWEPDAAVPTPSPRPTLTPTATLTPTPTVTPTEVSTETPTASATATKAPIQFGTLFLPYVGNELMDIATPTAGPSITPLPSASPTAEPERRLHLPYLLHEAQPAASATPGETAATTVARSATIDLTPAVTVPATLTAALAAREGVDACRRTDYDFGCRHP